MGEVYDRATEELMSLREALVISRRDRLCAAGSDQDGIGLHQTAERRSGAAIGCGDRGEIPVCVNEQFHWPDGRKGTASD